MSSFFFLCNEEERLQFTILYRIWGRLYFSEYVTKKYEQQVIRKNTITGIYIPLLDLIAEKKSITTTEIENLFFDADSVLTELIQGYLVKKQSKHEYKLNPHFLESIAPIIERLLKQLHDESDNKSSKGDDETLICFKCKRHDPIFKQLALLGSRLSCSNCHSTDIREQIIDPQEVNKCKNLIRKIQRWLEKKTDIEQKIKKSRQRVLRKQKQMIEEKVAKNFFEDLMDKIPTKRMISDDENNKLTNYYQNQYVQQDYVMRIIAHETDWIDKLKRIRESRK